MKALFLLPLLLTSCASTKAFLNPDQTISLSNRGSIAMDTDVWIKGAAIGQVTPARNLEVIQHTTVKGPRTRKLDCDGFVDATKEGRVEIQLALKSGKRWTQFWYNGSYKLFLN